MDSNDALKDDPQVQQLDAEVARLVARVEHLRMELGQAEEELRQYRTKDMEARRAVITRATADQSSQE
jgi:uncharacterized membrane protein YjjP (DUF1212 family)